MSTEHRSTRRAPLHPWCESMWQKIQAEKQRLPHAWLLTGSAGLGKKQLAHYLSAWLFCNAESAPCDYCKACILLNAHQHPDFYCLAANDKEAYTAQNIRLLRTNLLQSAQQGTVKVVLMEAADKLTISAANALLKIMEEPPAGVYFILVTDRPMVLPITLRSRCQRLHSPVPEAAQAANWLAAQTAQPAETINKALQLTYGAPLSALALLQDAPRLAALQKHANDFLAVLSNKRSALAVAAEWADNDAASLIDIIQYCLRRIIRQVCGITGQSKTQPFAHVPAKKWFALYDETLLGYQKILLTPGLNQQLFWEYFLLAAQDTTKG